MAADDFYVNALSDLEIKLQAGRTKKFYNIEQTIPVNIVRCLLLGSVLTVRGRRKLAYEVVDDNEMDDNDAKTEMIGDAVVIAVRRSVHEKAIWGDGRSRMTLAHELAHAVLHPGAVKFRRVGATGRTDNGRIPAYRSAEHQAKVFASAFLIHREQANKLGSAEEISAEFLVSLESAKILFDEIQEQNNRTENAAKILRMADDFRREVQAIEPKQQQFLAEICTACGNQKLIPIGVKYLCQCCGNVSDRFQDGDRIDP